MPRQPRLVLPGVALHVIQRGNNRSTCFLGESDHVVYLLHLRELAGKLDCDVHAYCLMTNHVHLLLTPRSTSGCGALMRDLGQRYVQYFNRHHGRSGTLWEGRFRSCVAESANYVLGCYRYIELNPVRAGMVGAPAQYRWSSHAGNIGLRVDPLIVAHEEYLALGSNEKSRRDAYRGLFDQVLEPSFLVAIREATNGGYPLSSDSLRRDIASMNPRRTEPGRPGRRRKSGSDPDFLA
jgi:putative transposase